jgi:hypothetical protein
MTAEGQTTGRDQAGLVARKCAASEAVMSVA